MKQSFPLRLLDLGLLVVLAFCAISCDLSDVLPTVETPIARDPTVTGVTESTATLGGTTGDGTSAITERGVIYGLAVDNPYYQWSQLDNFVKVTTGGTTGDLAVVITGLAPNTKYVFQAYARSADGGTGYSEIITFTTLRDVPMTGTNVKTVAVQPDGKYLIGGNFSMAGGAPHRNLARFLANGSVDANFTPNVVGTGVEGVGGGTVHCIVVQGDGKILIGGDFETVNGVARNNLARLHPDGSLDTSFDASTGIDDFVFALGIPFALGIQADGKIVVGGDFTVVNGTARNRIARLTASGALDPTFDPGNGPNSAPLCLAVQPDGKILVGGYFTTVRGTTRHRIARLTTTGAHDLTFNPGTGVDNVVRHLGLQPDGKILIGGYFSNFNGTARNHIARILENGALDTTFDAGAGPSSGIDGLALQADGKILIGGDFNSVAGTAAGTPRNKIARLNANGSLDATIDPGLGLDFLKVSGVALGVDGKILMGGADGAQPGTVLHARADNPGATQSLVAPQTTRVQWLRGGTGPEVSSVTFELSTDGGTTWTGLGAGTPIAGGWEHTGVTVPASGSLRARGRPADGSSSGLVEQVAPFSVLPVIIDPTAKSIGFFATDLGGNITSEGGSAITERGVVFARTAVNANPLIGGAGVTQVVAGGTGIGYFAQNVYADYYYTYQTYRAYATNAAGTSYTQTASFGRPDFPGLPTIDQPGTDLTDDGASSSGEASEPGPFAAAMFPPPAFVGSSVETIAVQPDGMHLIGGSFSMIGGAPHGNLARFQADGNVDTSFTTNVDGQIRTIAVQPDGRIVIGGAFTMVNGTPRSNIARLLPNGNLDTGFDPGSGPDGVVLSLGIQADGKIVVGGTFKMVNGTTRHYIARLTTTGAHDLTFNSGTGLDTDLLNQHAVYALAVQSDGNIVIAGKFTTFNGLPRNNIARLSSTGSLDATFTPGTGANDNLYCLGLQPDGKILIGGFLTNFNGTPRNHIARLLASGALDPTFDPGAGPLGGLEGLALQADGKILIAGYFDSVAGTPRNRVARLNANGSLDATIDPGLGLDFWWVYSVALRQDGEILMGGFDEGLQAGDTIYARANNPGATESLVAPDETRVQWLRGGTGPEVSDVTFDLSTDGGATWTGLGVGTRITGGWERTGVIVPPGGAVRVRARGRTSDGCSTGLIEKIEAFSVFPVVINPTSTSLSATGATLGGQITSDRGSAIIERGLVYARTADNANPQIGGPGVTRVIPPGTDTGVFTRAVTGLTPGTSYTFRAYATNADGTGYTVATGFMTNSTFPILIDPTSTGLTTTGATLGGNLTSDSGSAVTERGVVYARTEDNANPLVGGTGVTKLTATGTGKGVFTRAVSGLVPGAKYTYKAYAINAEGTGYTPPAGFETLSTLPVIIDPTSTGLTTTGATLGGYITSDGGVGITERGVIYARTADNANPHIGGSGVTKVIATGTGTGVFTTAVTGLLPGEHYTFKAYATNATGTRLTLTASFATVATLPVVIEPTSTGLTATGASLGGKITSDSGFAITERGVVYARTTLNPDPVIGGAGVTRVIATGKGTGVFTKAVTGLLIGAHYTFKAYATNASGTSYTEAAVFVTNFAPSVTTTGSSAVTGNSVTLSGEVKSDGGSAITERGILFGAVTGSDPLGTNASATKRTAGGTTGSYRVNATGLLPDTLYAFVAFATNGVGTSYGNPQTFTTTRTPPAQPEPGSPSGALTGTGTGPEELKGLPAGTHDVTFSAQLSAGGTVQAIAVLPDGKILIAGEFTTVGGANHLRLARIDANGMVDPTFTTEVNGPVYSIAVQGDGKILIGGLFNQVNGATRNGLARLESDGSVENSGTFSPGSGANNVIYSIAVQPDGKIVIGGLFTTVQGTARNRIARLEANGILDTTFQPTTGANDAVYSVAVQPDGKILLGGHFTNVNGKSCKRIARLLTSGALDNSFKPGSGADARITGVALQADGKILIGGSFANYSGKPRSRIARLLANGKLDTTFDPGKGANDDVYSLTMQSDGKILIGGSFTHINGTARKRIARLLANGALDTTFDPGSGANDEVHAVALQEDGSILIGGHFSSVAGKARQGIARLDNGPAPHSFKVVNGTKLTWMRGGAGPEVVADFVLSIDGGTTWKDLGTPVRIAGGWSLAGQKLPRAGMVRSIGKTAGGFLGGSSGVVGDTISYNHGPLVAKLNAKLVSSKKKEKSLKRQISSTNKKIKKTKDKKKVTKLKLLKKKLLKKEKKAKKNTRKLTKNLKGYP